MEESTIKQRSRGGTTVQRNETNAWLGSFGIKNVLLKRRFMNGSK